MAVIAPTTVGVGKNDGSTVTVQWTPVTEADSCGAVSLPEYTDRSIQVAGTFGSATVVLNGSNDGTNYSGLNDPGGTAISITSAKIKAVLENTVYTKPSISGGTSQSLTITMLFRLANPLRT